MTLATRASRMRERVSTSRREPLAGVGVVRDVGAQHLDRDGATARVEGEVHDPHAALADLLDEAVGADPLLETGTSGPRPRGRRRCGRPVRAPGRGVGTRSVRSYAVMPLRYATGGPTPERCRCVPRSVPMSPIQPVRPVRSQPVEPSVQWVM